MVNSCTSLASETVNLSPVTLGGATLDRRCRADDHLVLAHLLLAMRMAGRVFFVQKLCNGCRTTLHRQRSHRDRPVEFTDTQCEPVARPDFTRRLDALTVQFDPSMVDGLGGKTACLEEARSPQPFVEPHSVERRFFSWHRALRKGRRHIHVDMIAKFELCRFYEYEATPAFQARTGNCHEHRTG